MISDETLRKRWPKQLVTQIVNGNFILVVGAGASLNTADSLGQRPPTWEQLISRLMKMFSSGSTRKEIDSLLKQGHFLEAAEYLKIHARSKAKEQDFLNEIASATDGSDSAGGHLFKPGEFHRTLLRLNPKIIVTTNYDRILERATESGYNVHEPDSTSLARDIRSGADVIVKIHGSVNNANDIVLTRTDYSRLRRHGSEVLDILQALFLTKTALFVGYSLSDPDIQLLMENVLGARDEASAHYLLGSKKYKEYQKAIFKFCYGTDVIGFSHGDYAEMTRMLELLAETVESVQPEKL